MDGQPLSRDILLIAADWHSRTLTLAELQELGYDVMTVPGLYDGLRMVLRSQVAPRLTLVDMAQDDFGSPERVNELVQALPGVPVILVVGAFERASYAGLSDHLAALMVRPVRIGEIVDRVRALLPLTPERRNNLSPD